ncbi:MULTISPECIES: hypothetical protein [unclassified Streptomyces]|uniref:hypothetical protein n=1 Tax=unclassified Streptomyces TaxID=2593676 RepID=UPI00109EA7F4|nr:hypothetical protein [Streptomyces sp. A1136]THA57472.1 hypothetical protein E6R62_06270 [Streptomyces sp. A1136]
MRIRKFLAAAAMAGTVLTAGVATTGTASASSLADCSGHSETVCLYYNSSSSGHGAVFFQTSNISNYSGYYFSGGAYGSSGAGVSVKNHAAAVDSYYAGSFTVYYGSGDRNCSYACQTVPDYSYRDLNAQMKNNNAAGFFG